MTGSKIPVLIGNLTFGVWTLLGFQRNIVKIDVNIFVVE